MPRRKFSIIVTILVALILAAPTSEALVKKTAPKTSKSAAHAKVRKTKTPKTGKKIPYILAPTPDVLTPEVPHSHRFSPEFSDALARGDLSQAYRDLQLESASDKVGYMINQVLIAQGKTTHFDRATAYHNLYLFLARQGRPAPKFVKAAATFYQKAAKKADYTHKANVLLAALYTTAGDIPKSNKYFSKVDPHILTHGGDDYSGLEYLATYYAATQQPDKVIIYLDQAYKLNPGSLLQWLHVGDDFWAIEDDAGFQKQVEDWTIAHHQRITQLQRDKSTHGARKKAALAPKKSKKSAKKSGKKTR